MQILTSKRFAGDTCFVLLLILFANLFCAHADSSTWKPLAETDTAPIATAIVVHGLNTKPSAMDVLTSELQSMGISIVRIILPGHRGDFERWQQVRREDWVQVFQSTYRQVVEKLGDQPLFCVGFSLGSLVIIDSISTLTDPRVDRLVLFAPALTPHWYVHFVRLLEIFGTGCMIPSLTPVEYRANRGTSVAAYLALFEEIRHVFQTGFSKLRIPTLVFIDPFDELVDSKALERLIVIEELDMWNFVAVQSSSINSYHHFIIDPENVGDDCWSYMMLLMEEFLLVPGS